MKTCSSLLRMAVVLAIVAVLTPTSTLLAQQKQQKVSDERVTELMKAALQAVNSGQAVEKPVQQPQGPVVDLHIEEAVTRAMEQNIDLANQRLNPQIQDLALAGTRSVYLPTVSTTLGDSNATNQGTRTTSGGAITQTQTYTYNAGVSQAVPFYGGSVNLNFTNSRQDSSDNTSLFNPTYSSYFQATYTQPLWRNFKIDNNRQALWTGIISRQLADVSLRASVVNTEASTRIAYWNLVYAVQNLEVTKQSLALAEKLVQDNQAKVEIGTLAPLDVIQAQAQAATARANVVSAEQTRTTNEIALKRLIVNSAQDPLWNSTINPVDKPEPPAQAPALDLEALIRNALDQRTDLISARETLRSSEITLKYSKNLALPQADLQASYRAAGTGGTRYVCTGYVGAACVSKIIVDAGGYMQALGVIRKLNIPTWSFQLNFSYPIGVSAQDASYARAKVQFQQSQLQLKSLELQAATQVTSAALNVRNSLQQVETRRAARELAQKQLEAEQSKFDVGMSTNYNVVQMQNALIAAQTAELQAILNYRSNLVTLDQVQRTGSGSVSSVSSGGGGGAGGSSGGSGSSGGQ